VEARARQACVQISALVIRRSQRESLPFAERWGLPPWRSRYPPRNVSTLPINTRIEKETIMLWTIAVILGVLWILGLATSYTIGGFIHILLVLAIIVVLIRLFQGRRLTSV
jgi:hypothetical protein